jgi:hypothetical protein
MNKQHRQLTIELPDVSQSDLIDIARVLQSFTDAFIAHHQHELLCQQRAEQQLALFEVIDDEDNAPF